MYLIKQCQFYNQIHFQDGAEIMSLLEPAPKHKFVNVIAGFSRLFPLQPNSGSANVEYMTCLVIPQELSGNDVVRSLLVRNKFVRFNIASPFRPHVSWQLLCRRR